MLATARADNVMAMRGGLYKFFATVADQEAATHRRGRARFQRMGALRSNCLRRARTCPDLARVECTACRGEQQHERTEGPQCDARYDARDMSELDERNQHAEDQYLGHAPRASQVQDAKHYV